MWPGTFALMALRPVHIERCGRFVVAAVACIESHSAQRSACRDRAVVALTGERNVGSSLGIIRVPRLRYDLIPRPCERQRPGADRSLALVLNGVRGAKPAVRLARHVVSYVTGELARRRARLIRSSRFSA